MSAEIDPVVRERFRRYVERFRQGHGDPDPVMEGLDRERRYRLRQMIDGFLDTGPVPDAGAPGPEVGEVGEIVAAIVPLLDGRAGGLSRLLVRRRQELELNQADVVASLARDLEASAGETGKIDAYYHDLEWGSLPAAGLTDRLLDSLAKALRTTRERLREAGRELGPARAGATGPVFARNADEIGTLPELGMASPGVEKLRAATPPDRIDLLFTGG